MNIMLKLQELYGIVDIEKWICEKVVIFIIFSYIDLKIFTTLFQVEIDKKTKIKTISIIAILKIISVIAVPAPYYRALDILIVILAFNSILKINIEKCILAETINAITILSGEVIFSKLSCLVFPDLNKYLDVTYNYLYDFFLMISICSWRMIIYYICKKAKIVINLSDNLSKRDKCSVMIISIIGCTVIFFNVVEMSMFMFDFPYYIFILDIGSLLLYFSISIKNIVKINKLEEQDMKIHTLENYNRTLSIMYDKIREFKHDFNNFVQALDGYVNTENIDGIKKMTDSILKDCRNVNNMEMLDPAIINNPAIYSIITNKYYLAKNENINMNIEVMINLNEINISTYNLCKILGILLDNAIEAARECDEKIVNVRFIKDNKCNRKLIIIENSYNKLDIDIDKIFEKGYSTKEENSSEHGLGLWTIRNILNQSKNLNLFTIKEKLFKQQLEIY